MAAMPMFAAETWLADVLKLVDANPAGAAIDVPDQIQAIRKSTNLILTYLGLTLRTIDVLLESIEHNPNIDLNQAARVIAQGRELREQLFSMMAHVVPDQAWFWTEEWQAGERQADADIAAGRTTVYESDEAFITALEARIHDAQLVKSSRRFGRTGSA